MEKIYLNENDMRVLVVLLCERIMKSQAGTTSPLLVYGVPRGGVPVAYRVKGYIEKTYGWIVNLFEWNNILLCEDNFIIVDDIIDSGRTRVRCCGKFDIPFTRFFALFDREVLRHDLRWAKLVDGWVVFPWENGENGEQDASAEDIPLRFLQYIGENPDRDGLKDTPKRMIRSWDELYGGYKQKPEDVLRLFDNEEQYDEMVLLRDVEFFSSCEHHVLPFFGRAHIGYIPKPGGKVVGISKLARLLDIFARRLQIQERLTKQIADAIQTHLDPIGVAVVLEAQHFCMTSRGVRKQNSVMVTSAMLGIFRDNPAARSEFLTLIRRK